LHSALPEGYVDIDRGNWRVVAPRLELAEMAALLDAARAGTLKGEDAPSGRGGACRLALRGGKIVFVRRYLRGGLVRHFVKDLFVLRPPRPLLELVATEKARAAGCLVPMVHAVAVEETGPFYRGWIVTAAIDGARDFIDVYAETDPTGREHLLAEAGRAIHALHDAGVFHPDLTGNNLLVVSGGSVAVIDFDRAVVTSAGSPGLARKGLDRFWRSMAKLATARGIRLEPDERRALERGYAR
jgi:3-deoxy-D-manno-octulosonic acid kinase